MIASMAHGPILLHANVIHNALSDYQNLCHRSDPVIVVEHMQEVMEIKHERYENETVNNWESVRSMLNSLFHWITFPMIDDRVITNRRLFLSNLNVKV